ncbi:MULTISPECIES: host cell division inhibitor Icd-like protein [Enterobacter cloacae complex]|uniref:host cell division inhibitor Icd-like protein n=1 Tax=Enterobacter cloacae complex TaxID=354276 RepID=UPI001876B7B9|nr:MULTISPECIES: host cell division inhibitor Icd-like protein [Enterobacter cloacae complex]MBE4895193.1 host cell division inhibitor Icd-like protein [Enterobacter cloacae complex sp. P16RS2]
MCEKRLFSGERPLYSFRAAAKSAAGRENPSFFKATPDAPCVFFCVYALVHLSFALRFLCRSRIRVMVIRAGQPSGWPVSLKAGFSPPFGSPPERENSGGGVNRYFKEIVLMTTALTVTHPEFTFIFAAVRRTDAAARPCMLRTVAGDERSARASLARDYVLSFAGRLPVKAVAA